MVLLTVSVAFIPAVTRPTVRASNEDNFSDFSIEVVGIQNDCKKTIHLTPTQEVQLREYLQDFQKNINKSTSLQETKDLYYDALFYFDTLKLLPAGITPELLFSQICRKIREPSLTLVGSNSTVRNYCCLTSGELNKMHCSNHFIYLLEYPFNFLGKVYEKLQIWAKNSHSIILKILLGIPSSLIYRISVPFMFFLCLAELFTTGSKIALLQDFGAGEYYYDVQSHYREDPSSGNIQTFGLTGQSNNSGTFFGALPRLPIVYGFGTSPLGVAGFTGIKIVKGSWPWHFFFLGSAFAIELDPYP